MHRCLCFRVWNLPARLHPHLFECGHFSGSHWSLTRTAVVLNQPCSLVLNRPPSEKEEGSAQNHLTGSVPSLDDSLEPLLSSTQASRQEESKPTHAWLQPSLQPPPTACLSQDTSHPLVCYAVLSLEREDRKLSSWCSDWHHDPSVASVTFLCFLLSRLDIVGPGMTQTPRSAVNTRISRRRLRRHLAGGKVGGTVRFSFL